MPNGADTQVALPESPLAVASDSLGQINDILTDGEFAEGIAPANGRWTRNSVMRDLRRRKERTERELAKVNAALDLVENTPTAIEMFRTIREVLY